MVALQHWGSQWAELTPEQAHPGVVLWMWVTFYLDHDRLPRRRVLVRFDYPTLSGPGSRGWLLIERGDAEVCEKYPGGEEHLVVVVNDPVAFARWHLGELRWGDALRSGAIEVQGARTLARSLPTWHRDHPDNAMVRPEGTSFSAAIVSGVAALGAREIPRPDLASGHQPADPHRPPAGARGGQPDRARHRRPGGGADLRCAAPVRPSRRRGFPPRWCCRRPRRAAI